MPKVQLVDDDQEQLNDEEALFLSCPGYPHCDGTRPVPKAVIAGASKLFEATTRTTLEEPTESADDTEERLRHALYDRQVAQGEFHPGKMAQYEAERIED